MEYAKIIVKNNYEKRGDLVLRSYIRAIKKANAGKLLDGENALIYGVIDDNNNFHELFTNRVINYDNYVPVSIDELFAVSKVSSDKKALLEKIMNTIIFGDKIDIDFEVSSIEDLAKDRAIEFDAYHHFLSRINPYLRLSEIDNQDLYNAYNNFLYKIREVMIINKKNNKIQNYDEYDVDRYQEKPNNETDEKEYLVFEIPKRLIKK